MDGCNNLYRKLLKLVMTPPTHTPSPHPTHPTHTHIYSKPVTSQTKRFRWYTCWKSYDKWFFNNRQLSVGCYLAPRHHSAAYLQALGMCALPPDTKHLLQQHGSQTALTAVHYRRHTARTAAARQSNSTDSGALPPTHSTYCSSTAVKQHWQRCTTADTQRVLQQHGSQTALTAVHYRRHTARTAAARQSNSTDSSALPPTHSTYCSSMAVKQHWQRCTTADTQHVLQQHGSQTALTAVHYRRHTARTAAARQSNSTDSGALPPTHSTYCSSTAVKQHWQRCTTADTQRVLQQHGSQTALTAVHYRRHTARTAAARQSNSTDSGALPPTHSTYCSSTAVKQHWQQCTTADTQHVLQQHGSQTALTAVHYRRHTARTAAARQSNSTDSGALPPTHSTYCSSTAVKQHWQRCTTADTQRVLQQHGSQTALTAVHYRRHTARTAAARQSNSTDSGALPPTHSTYCSSTAVKQHWQRCTTADTQRVLQQHGSQTALTAVHYRRHTARTAAARQSNSTDSGALPPTHSAYCSSTAVKQHWQRCTTADTQRVLQQHGSQTALTAVHYRRHTARTAAARQSNSTDSGALPPTHSTYCSSTAVKQHWQRCTTADTQRVLQQHGSQTALTAVL